MGYVDGSFFFLNTAVSALCTPNDVMIVSLMITLQI